MRLKKSRRSYVLFCDAHVDCGHASTCALGHADTVCRDVPHIGRLLRKGQFRLIGAELTTFLTWLFG